MPRLEDIPKPAYEELKELIGEAEAIDYIKKVNYSYRTIAQRILYIRIRRFLSKKHPIYAVLFLILLALLIVYFLRDFIFF